ncbi:hypothetical protein FHR81_001468 [Actinoalloteichus hoggarensis]|uniref:Uncharacterized protein n=1 Tax=Actinoalloteichus hoggarensis TaxID=1470176 RepID=A0A221W0W8_9PSEU|nr:hypothetical protein AHOG_07780 [Actinoalloteichus hoggarensis]MBB5920438.1 hypothetical protein [Actinoalloteichus hoggarensis]
MTSHRGPPEPTRSGVTHQRKGRLGIAETPFSHPAWLTMHGPPSTTNRFPPGRSAPRRLARMIPCDAEMPAAPSHVLGESAPKPCHSSPGRDTRHAFGGESSRAPLNELPPISRRRSRMRASTGPIPRRTVPAVSAEGHSPSPEASRDDRSVTPAFVVADVRRVRPTALTGRVAAGWGATGTTAPHPPAAPPVRPRPLAPGSASPHDTTAGRAPRNHLDQRCHPDPAIASGDLPALMKNRRVRASGHAGPVAARHRHALRLRPTRRWRRPAWQVSGGPAPR